MKYKFEIWKYGIFDFKQAEEHLNAMSRQGWELHRITLEWMPMACYRRAEKNSKPKQYAFAFHDLQPDAEDAMLAFYSGTGWTLCQKFGRNNQYLFCSESEKKIGLYSDEISQMESAMAATKSSSNFILSIISLVIGPLFTIYIYKNWQLPYMNLLVIFIIIVLLFAAVGITANFYFLGRMKKRGGDIEAMPRSLVMVNYVNGWLGMTLLYGLCLIVAFIAGIRQGDMFLILTPFISLGFALTGYAVRVIGGKTIIGVILMFIGVCILFYAFMNSITLLM